MERVIITAQVLVDLFADREPHQALFLLAPFIAPDPIRVWDEYICDAIAAPEHPGKAGLIEVYEDFKQAWLKMSVFERESVRKALPQALAEQWSRRG